MNLDETALHTKEAFEIGRDFGAHRIGLPANPRACQAFAQGRLVGLTEPAQPDNDWTRKWLQLRFNAWHRGKIVQPNVTAEYLRGIYVQKCDVTQILLTRRENKLSDWSIDRLNNDGAYAHGNLAVMSTRANSAKGALAFADVCARADGLVSDEALTSLEWARLASMMEGPCSVGGRVVEPRPYTGHAMHAVLTTNQTLQFLAVWSFVGRPGAPSRNDVVQHLAARSKQSWLRLRKKWQWAVDRLTTEEKRKQNPLEILLIPTVWTAYLKLFNGLTQFESGQIATMRAKPMGTEQLSDNPVHVEEFALASGGFRGSPVR